MSLELIQKVIQRKTRNSGKVRVARVERDAPDHSIVTFSIGRGNKTKGWQTGLKHTGHKPKKAGRWPR